MSDVVNPQTPSDNPWESAAPAPAAADPWGDAGASPSAAAPAPSQASTSSGTLRKNQT